MEGGQGGRKKGSKKINVFIFTKRENKPIHVTMVASEGVGGNGEEGQDEAEGSPTASFRRLRR